MKRFLALSVVLVMLLCSFTSCDLIDEIINGEFETEEETEKSTDKDTEQSTEKSTVASTERVTEPHWWDDGLYEDLNDKINGGTNKNETDKPETDKPETDKPETGNIANMEAINDTVYVLYDANIREKTSSKASSNVIGKAPFGAVLTRSAKNNTWSKVTYVTDSGATIEGYIMNELITTNKQTVTFVEQKNADGGEVVTKLKGSSTYRLRHFPLANGYPHTVTLELSEIGHIYGGTEVTVLSVSEDKMWAYIRCSYVDVAINGAYIGENFVEREGYIIYEFLEISDDNTEDSPQQSVGPAVG